MKSLINVPRDEHFIHFGRLIFRKIIFCELQRCKGTLASFSHSLYPEYIHTQNLNKMSIWWHHQASAEDIHLYESKAISKNIEMLAQSFHVFHSYSQRTEESTKLPQVHKIHLFVRFILVCCRFACLVSLQARHLKCHKCVCCNKGFPFRSSFCRFPGTQPTILCIVVEKIYRYKVKLSLCQPQRYINGLVTFTH